MRYTLDNGKSVNIPKSEIEKLMSSLELSEKDAIDLWLCDNNLEEDEEQTELDEKASKVRIDKDIIQKKPKKERKKPEKKVSDEKKELFNSILTNFPREKNHRSCEIENNSHPKTEGIPYII